MLASRASGRIERMRRPGEKSTLMAPAFFWNYLRDVDLLQLEFDLGCYYADAMDTKLRTASLNNVQL